METAELTVDDLNAVLRGIAKKRKEKVQSEFGAREEFKGKVFIVINRIEAREHNYTDGGKAHEILASGKKPQDVLEEFQAALDEATKDLYTAAEKLQKKNAKGMNHAVALAA